jgi:nitrate/TMAO reductase-like tetraheme cytochrome c subunit
MKLLIATAGLIFIGLLIVVGGVQGFIFTESVEFCGTICHPMDSMLKQYKLSAHANVDCAQCHVGEGFDHYVKAKVDGLRELQMLILNTYPRPIKSPVENLRPARETCETCHSPSTFKDNITKTIMHYDNDQANTPELTTLILKMGGWKSSTGVMIKGIHWHVSSEMYYIALDTQRQVIGWVGVRQPDGSLKEFFASDLVGMSQKAFVEEARAKGEIRQLDCIDCHNRTAHYIPNPENAVDTAISDGLISTDLPFVRKQAVGLLSVAYKSKEEAFTAIEKMGIDYAADSKIPVVLIDQAVKTLEGLYAQTNFPDMNLDWTSNPNNVGHTPTMGCYRCHDGKHVTAGADGVPETISVECNLCHTVPIEGKGSEMMVEAPVIVGNVPDSHIDFSWTITHQNITETQKNECYQCHGQAFCNNGACHNLSHPTDMAFTHAAEVKRVGAQVCVTCHQDITCSRCHPGGITNPKAP